MSDILEKLRKLLALAKSSNEHEAANAAAKATALAAKYQVDLAILDLEANKPPRGYSVHTNILYTFPGNAITWISVLGNQVGELHRLRVYIDRYNGASRLMAIGDPGDTEVAGFILGWLIGEVERLLTTAKPSGMDRGMSKAWCNAFRVGCASRIGERLKEEGESQMAKLTAAPDASEYATADSDKLLELDRRHRYAMVLQDKEKEHLAGIDAKAKAMKLRSRGRVHLRSWGGYQAGKAAGNQAHLKGNGLPS